MDFCLCSFHMKADIHFSAGFKDNESTHRRFTKRTCWYRQAWGRLKGAGAISPQSTSTPLYTHPWSVPLLTAPLAPSGRHPALALPEPGTSWQPARLGSGGPTRLSTCSAGDVLPRKLWGYYSPTVSHLLGGHGIV